MSPPPTFRSVLPRSACAAWACKGNGTQPVGENGIGEGVETGKLEKDGCVIDESDSLSALAKGSGEARARESGGQESESAAMSSNFMRKVP